MFESVVGTLLTKFLGDYVEGLEGENLKVNILGGHVVLENLRLKKEALSRYQLPITIKDGYLGKLVLEIPWNALGKRPIRVTVEDIYFIAKPTQAADYNPKAVEENKQNSKKRKLELSEAILAEEEQQTDGLPSSVQKTYTQRLIDSATSLFDIEIKRVHFRYEDNLVNNSSFAVGVTLESFSATSLGKESSELVQHFSASMKHFSIYWNEPVDFLKYDTAKEMGNQLKAGIFSDSCSPDHKYILNPICGSLKGQLNKKVELDIPKLLFSAAFDRIQLSLRERQWKQILYFSEYLTLYSRGIKYIHIRPESPSIPQKEPLRWWKFVLEGIRAEERKKREKWKWSSFQRYKDNRASYILLWQKKLRSSTCSEELQGKISQAEEKLAYEDILIFRKLATAAHSQNDLNSSNVSQVPEVAGGGWFSWAWGGAKTADADSEPEMNWTIEQWRSLYKEIDFMGEYMKKKVIDTPEEFIQLKSELRLESVSLRLWCQQKDKSKETNFVTLGFEGLDLHFLKRIDSISLASSVSSVIMHDFLTLPKGKIEMLSLHEEESKSTAKFLSIEFEKNPLDKLADLRLHINALQSRTITCSRKIIDTTATFFRHGSNATQLKQVANENWASVKRNASLRLQSALDNHQRFDLQVDIVAPNIVLPSSYGGQDISMLQLDLGKLSFHSKIDQTYRSEDGTLIKELGNEEIDDENFYDHFDLTCVDMCAAVYPKFLDITHIDPKPFQILSNFSILLRIGVCIISDPKIPKLNFQANFPAFLALVSPDKLKRLVSVCKAYLTSTVEVGAQEAVSVENPGEIVPLYSQLPKKPQPIEAVNGKFIVATFEFGDVSILFHQGEKDILLVSVQNFQLNALKTSHNFTTSLMINTFFIEDKIQQLEEFKYIITSSPTAPPSPSSPPSPPSSDLVSIQYKHVPKDSPAFKIIENDIQCSFNELNITINRETLVQVIQFTKNCLAIVDTSDSPHSTGEVNHQKEEQEAAQNHITLTTAEKGVTSTVANTIAATATTVTTVLFKSKTSVEKISVNLIAEGKNFAYAALHSSTINAEAYSNKEYKISGTMGHIRIEDLSEQTKWKEIIRIDSNHILEFWFETIKPTKESDTGKMIITVEMASIHCVYLSRFVRQLANYFNEFSLMQELLTATASKARERAKEKAKEITKIIIYDISIANPIVVVPRSFKNEEYLLFNVGNIIMNNEIDIVDSSELLDCISVSIDAFGFVAATHDPSFGDDKILKRRSVVPDTMMDVTVHRPLTPHLKDVHPSSVVHVTLPHVTIDITESQVELMMGILYENLSDVPTSTTKAIQEKIGSEIASVKHELLSPTLSEAPKVVGPSITSKILVRLDKLSLELYQGSGSIQSQSSSIGKFSMEGFQTCVVSQADQSKIIEVTTKTISLVDTRLSSASIHKDMITPLYINKEKPQWKVEYTRKGDGHQTIEILILTSRMLLVPEFISALTTSYHRIMGRIQALKDKQERKKENEEMSGTHTHTPMPPQRDPSRSDPILPVGIVTTLRLVEPELCLIEDETDCQSRALVMKETFNVNFSMLEGRQSAQVAVTNIQIYKTKLGTSHLVTILTPFDLLLNYSQHPDLLSIVLEIDPIQFTLSYLDVRMIMNIQQRWSQHSEEPIGTTERIEKDGKEEDKEEKKDEKKEEEVVERQEEHGKDARGGRKELARIMCDSVSIILLNDLYDGGSKSTNQIPLMSIHFDRMKCEVENWSSLSMKGSISLKQLRAFSFNNKMNCFEPMIEPWDCYALMGKVEELQVKIGASDPFYLNLSKQFVETMLLSLEQWQSEYAEEKGNYGSKSVKRKKRTHPFYLYNSTGLPLTYWFTQHPEHKTRVENGGKVPLELHNEEQLQRERYASLLLYQKGKFSSSHALHQSNEKENRLSIQIEDPGFVPLHNLAMNKKTENLFQNISNRDKELRLLYKVYHEDASKILYFGSDIVITNESIVPLELLLLSPLIAPNTMPPLPPGESTSVPIRYALTSKIQIRPQGFAYGWSQEYIHCSLDRKSSSSPFFSCLSQDRKDTNSPHWIYSVEQKGVRAKRCGSGEDYELHFIIRAPFTIENTLPCKITYRIQDAMGVNLTSGGLGIGMCKEIYHILPDHRPLLQFKLPSCEWSELKKIGGNKKSTLHLMNSNMESFHIQIQSEQSLIGARSCTIYSRFLIINQTGQKLFYQAPAVIRQASHFATSESELVHASSSQFELPVTYFDQTIDQYGQTKGIGAKEGGEDEDRIYVKPVIFNAKQILIRSEFSDWSKPVYLQQQGGVVHLPQRKEKEEISSGGKEKEEKEQKRTRSFVRSFSKTNDTFRVIKKCPSAEQFGISVSTGPGKFWRSSVVQIRPYSILINHFSTALSFQQYDVPSTKIRIEAGEQKCFHWFEYERAHHLQVSSTEDADDLSWSSPFNMGAAASFRLPLKIQEAKYNNKTPNIDVLSIKVEVSLCSVIASFGEAEKQEADYMIRNQSQFTLLLGQDNTPESITLSPFSSHPYAWCVPLEAEKKLHIGVCHSPVSSSLCLDKLCKFDSLHWESQAGSCSLHMEVSADGLTKILTLKGERSGESGIGTDSYATNESGYQQVSAPLFSFGLDLALIGISFIDEQPREILFVSVEKLQVLYCTGHENESFQLIAESAQIDNQLSCTPCPILLSSAPVQNQPFFQLSFLTSSRYTHLRYIPYFAVKIQEMDLQIDESCLLSVLHFADSITQFSSSDSSQKEAENALFLFHPGYEVVKSVSGDPIHSPDSTALYFELFHINPIKVNLTFCASTGEVNQTSKQSILERSLRAGGFLANIDAAPLRLNGLILENPMCSQAELISRVGRHYTLQVMADTYKILGSVDILGSPVSLVNNLGTGVYDFFHEPVEGSVGNPMDFAAGVARGTTSLVQNSVFGIFNSASKITGSISKAATSISMDDTWKAKQARKYRAAKPTDVSEGLTSGFKRLGTGLFDGITGVISQPIRGLEDGGAAGLAKGMGKGFSGLILRPVVGVVDLITDTTEGIKNTAAIEGNQRERRRKPRFIGIDKNIVPFDPERSALQFILRTVDEGVYDHLYVLESWVISEQSFILLSNKRIFCFSTASSSSLPKKVWSAPIQGIKVAITREGLLLSCKNNRKIPIETTPDTAVSIRKEVAVTIKRQVAAAAELQYFLTDPFANQMRERKPADNIPLPHVPNRGSINYISETSSLLGRQNQNSISEPDCCCALM